MKINKQTNKQVLGIIGGHGSETTADFFMHVVRGFRERGAKVQPNIFVSNAPVNVANFKKVMTTGRGFDGYIPLLINQSQCLERAGATMLCLPCNTLHKFHREIAVAVDVPVLSIVDETVVFLACTDLQVLWGEMTDPRVMDTMRILADAALKIMLS